MIEIMTPRHSSACGLTVGLNEDWVIFAKKGEHGFYYTNRCSRSRGVKNNQDYNEYIVFLEKLINSSDGYQEFYYSNRNLAAKGLLKDLKPEGEWEFYNENGFLKLTGFYKNGIRDSVWFEYNWYGMENERETKYIYKNGKLKSVHWLDDQENISSETYFENDREIENGYYQNGKLKRKLISIKSKYLSYYKEYYQNGQLKEEATFKDGEYEGRKFYSNEGELLKEINYEENTKTLYYTESEKYDSLFLFIQSRAEEFVASSFGEYFFKKRIKFQSSQSFFYGNDYEPGSSWFLNTVNFEPKIFLMRFAINFNDSLKFTTIQFEMDNKGNLLKNKEILGINNSKVQDFKIDYNGAIEIAERNGLDDNEGNHQVKIVWKSEFPVENYYKEKELNNSIKERIKGKYF